MQILAVVASDGDMCTLIQERSGNNLSTGTIMPSPALYRPQYAIRMLSTAGYVS
ncbi:Hypothetical protein FKW44_009057 [Caligus rogercresseyi]|uniref:Uncharacterized protein n=1 Tax=Caligus rogercresseyi TaxID=217165 RepID=A0A7T8HFS4_CALRO|nr:Hypothetical protein FKW44_009057 [Caligus rogercresseyi]